MKQFLLLLSVLFLGFSMSAQIASGTKLSGNIVAKDLKGKDVDIYADLAAGKTVVIDVFATWCGPCWSFHENGVLKELNSLLGPGGTDQIRIYAIEGDERTPEDLIYAEASGGTAATTSLGDWTAGVEYSIINSSSFNTLLNIAFFPTLYVIRPDKTVLEMGNFRYNPVVWQKALVPTAEKDLVFTSSIGDKSFCASGIFNSKPTVINLGTTAISTIETDLSINGQSTPTITNKALGVFQSGELSFGTKTFTATTEVKVTIVSVDSKVDEPDDLSEIVGNFYKPVVESKKMTVKFTTDYYPAETSWKLTDNKSRTLASATYKEGPDQFGGGGDDANTEHVYEVSIDNTTDVNCLIITLTDAYGDGMTAFNNTVPTPGVEFYNEKGELIKPKLSTEYNFQSANPGTDASSTKSYAAFSLNTSLEDASFVENLNVYPNPVADILNIDMKIKAGTEYEVFVTNTMGAPVTTITQNTNFINVANLAAGMYFLNVKTNEGIFAHKFTKI